METFLKNPTLDLANKLNRKDLFSICKELKIQYTAILKNETLRDRIILHYINEGIFDYSLLEQVSGSDVKSVEEKESEAHLAIEEARLAIEEKESEARIALEREVKFRMMELDYNADKTKGQVRDDISQVICRSYYF